ncbi:putative pre-rRNA-processing protein esf2 [Penaeus monodon]|uniref:putative pre-rRNA-processing protein esf2 n=1 Tax=Penaeus monodon TaxID=6687 RepID=UPI0018A72FFD|nr:putative pre-rRNA-processing protein esf2 [Penaeus monodon]
MGEQPEVIQASTERDKTPKLVNPFKRLRARRDFGDDDAADRDVDNDDEDEKENDFVDEDHGDDDDDDDDDDGGGNDIKLIFSIDNVSLISNIAHFSFISNIDPEFYIAHPPISTISNFSNISRSPLKLTGVLISAALRESLILRNPEILTWRSAKVKLGRFQVADADISQHCSSVVMCLQHCKIPISAKTSDV